MNKSRICTVALFKFQRLIAIKGRKVHLQYTWKPTMDNGGLLAILALPIFKK
jgi:hypothetical protein